MFDHCRSGITRYCPLPIAHCQLPTAGIAKFLADLNLADELAKWPEDIRPNENMICHSNLINFRLRIWAEILLFTGQLKASCFEI